MRTRLAADRQIRAAAALAAPTLDVRGPVSEALGRAGIAVPPVEAPETEVDLEAASGPTIGRPAAKGLRPTRKPFAPAPWPTRGGTADPEADPLSGLTPDERRVHRILLDALARENANEGLSYAAKKRLDRLDLAFINAELAKMTERQARASEWGRLGLLAALFVLPLAVGLALVAGADAPAVLPPFLGALAAVSAGLLGLSAKSGGASPRRQIYEALRELALLVDDAPVSDALRQADQLIDHFAEPAAPPRTAAPSRRVRS